MELAVGGRQATPWLSSFDHAAGALKRSGRIAEPVISRSLLSQILQDG